MMTGGEKGGGGKPTMMKMVTMTYRRGVMAILEGSPNGMLCLGIVERERERGWRWRERDAGT